MTKEIIHFELFGPGKSKGYFDRIKEHEEEEKRRKIEIERKEVKSTFQKVQISTEGHEGVNKTTSKWETAFANIMKPTVIPRNDGHRESMNMTVMTVIIRLSFSTLQISKFWSNFFYTSVIII